MTLGTNDPRFCILAFTCVTALSAVLSSPCEEANVYEKLCVFCSMSPPVSFNDTKTQCKSNDVELDVLSIPEAINLLQLQTLSNICRRVTNSSKLFWVKTGLQHDNQSNLHDRADGLSCTGLDALNNMLVESNCSFKFYVICAKARGQDLTSVPQTIESQVPAVTPDFRIMVGPQTPAHFFTGPQYPARLFTEETTPFRSIDSKKPCSWNCLRRLCHNDTGACLSGCVGDNTGDYCDKVKFPIELTIMLSCLLVLGMAAVTLLIRKRDIFCNFDIYYDNAEWDYF
ncbi:uncharacterized protein LOC106071607 [Biomphalaria glabrata]|uniref:Uncharacterized protein LOC106071607 n=1 Tax=Biomphalaria glabrata TaxID=6526 RepID=A0A9W2YX49_BIOGL|nr:uncharacterized protein LOC106071607 [Biomphalaria glabrata]